MQPVIRPIAAHELDLFVDTLEMAAGRQPSDDARVDGRTAYAPERSLGVFDGGRLVGGLGWDLLELTVPGPAVVPAARAMLGAVLPTHRRRGLMTTLGRRQLHDIREAGIGVVTAASSSPPVAVGLGYGPATTTMDLTIDIAGIEAKPTVDDRWRLLEPRELPTVLPPLFDAHRKAQPGQVCRRDSFWAMWLLDRKLFRLGTGPRFAVVHEDDSRQPDGYLTYRLEPGPLRDQPIHALVVEDLIAARPETRAALWRYCLEFQQAREIHAFNVAPDEPLVWTLLDRRRWRPGRLRPFLWLRIVRVADMLCARRYAIPGRLTIEVGDDVLPDNAGRYHLDSGPDGAIVKRTGAAADLALGVDMLAAVYLGATSFTTLAQAGKVDERTHGALRRADVMFGCATAPWTVTDW